MTGIKRRRDELRSTSVKKAKVDGSSQQQNSKVRQSALPSPEDSSAASEDIVNTHNIKIPPRQAPKDGASPSKRKVSETSDPANLSTSTGGGVLNGDYLRKSALRCG